MTNHILKSGQFGSDILNGHLEGFLANTFAHVYWKDINGKYLGGNDNFILGSGVGSHNELVGSTDMDQPWHKQARIMMLNDKKVVVTEKRLIKLEQAQIPNSRIVNFLSCKSPLRSSRGKVIGVIGLSYVLNDQLQNSDKLHEISLMTGMNSKELEKKFRININPPSSLLSHLTLQQQTILKHILHGLSAKEIAKIMSLSFRTVEFHTNNIKLILKANSKSDLISIAIKENLIRVFFNVGK